MDVNIIEKGIEWIDKVLALMDKYRVRTILKAIVVIVILGLSIAFLKNPTWIFEQYKEWADNRHTELMNTRIKNSEKMQNICERLLYRLDAQRVLILEMHNGNTGEGGLPFAKATATYEAIETGVTPVASQYQSINLSLIPFATYLITQKTFAGDTDTLETLDKSLCYKMKSNATEHFAAVVIDGVDKPLAIMIVSFDDKNLLNISFDDILEIMKQSSLEVALLLELNHTEDIDC